MDKRGPISEHIAVELAKQQRSILWLSEQTGIARPTLTRRLANDSEFKLSELTRIAGAIGAQPSDLIAGYYAEDKQAA